MGLVVEEINGKDNLTDSIYVIIKKNILNWNLKPGTKISETEIAKAFQVSRTPIREAFKRLSFENLLETRPQRGTYVSLINLHLMDEGRFIRESLECSVIKEGIDRRYLEKYIAELQELIYTQREAVQQHEYDAFYALDEKFHNIFFEAADRNFSKSIAINANIDYLRVRIACMKSDPCPMILCDHHQLLLDAIIKKDKKTAEDVLKVHLNKVFKDLEQIKKEYEKYYI